MLLSLNRLPTLADVREYLSYSIKIYELANKYSWGSVLQYDNEFRILQHTYVHLWSMDNSHIHEVMLIVCMYILSYCRCYKPSILKNIPMLYRHTVKSDKSITLIFT